ncbi:MAG TPA: Gfo/Idh/MocA family oxidoreductase [Candidatus Hydrogenedentes bacterium]|mgnify:CR=1 FL=1|nr:Gfo/Idh/MocA family oxidoreductase [Candidatus Hydrogenedentota bacterium]
MQPQKNRAGISRRAFVKAAGAGLAAPLLLPARARGANERIRMGVIGTGSRGAQVMMEGFVPDKGVEVALVCDPQRARREQAAKLVNNYYERNECAHCNDFRDVLARDDIAAVLITAPDHWHGVMATMAANAGKDMYCEKPLGLCVRDGQAIRDAVRRNNIIFQTGTQQRSTRNFRHACELALGGYIGNVHTIEVAAPGPSFKPKYDGSLDPQPVPEGMDWELYTGPAPMRPFNPGRLEWPDWYLISDYCIGFIVNWGVHHLDIAAWGCPRLITQPFECECEADYRSKGFTDNINGWRAEFTYPDGLRMRYSDTDNPWPQGVCFRGDEGWVHVSRKSISAEPASLLELELPAGENRLHESNHHARDFIEAVKARRDPVSPVESGHQASNLGLIPEIAARLKRKLRWDPVADQFHDDAEATALLAKPLRAPWRRG